MADNLPLSPYQMGEIVILAATRFRPAQAVVLLDNGDPANRHYTEWRYYATPLAVQQNAQFKVYAHEIGPTGRQLSIEELIAHRRAVGI